MQHSTRPHEGSPRLVALDIDGTLLGPDGLISVENHRAVTRLRDWGVEVVLASGRSHANMLRYHQELGLTTPLVSVHGAVVRGATDDIVHGVVGLDEEIARRLTTLGRTLGASVIHYRTDGIFLETPNALSDFDQTRNVDPQRVIPDLLEPHEAVLHKIMWLADADHITQVTPRAIVDFGDRVTIYPTEPGYLEFVALGVTKSTGVAIYMRELGLQPSEVAAFGDGNNDAPMLAWAGTGVAMSHGTAAAKAAARFTSPEGPPQTALARALEMVFPCLNLSHV